MVGSACGLPCGLRTCIQGGAQEAPGIHDADQGAGWSTYSCGLTSVLYYDIPEVGDPALPHGTILSACSF